MTNFTATNALTKADYMGKDFKNILLAVVIGFLMGTMFTVQLENEAKTDAAYDKADIVLTQVK